MKPTIEVKNIYKSFSKKEVLKGLSFFVYPGEIFVLLGPNGAGKTTTVKILAGVLESDSGEVFILSEKVSVLNIGFKKFIGYLPDDPYLYNKLTGKEFLDFILSIYRIKPNIEEYNFFLKQFDLEDILLQPIETYSKGTKQKLLLTSIFLRKPEIYIFDEPLVGLDPKSISFLKKYLLELAANGKTLVLCTHILELAWQIAKKIAIINDGKIVFENSKDVLCYKSLEDIYFDVVDYGTI